MKKYFFRLLNSINQKVLPRYSRGDPAKLSKFQQAILAFRYYVLVNSLD